MKRSIVLALFSMGLLACSSGSVEGEEAQLPCVTASDCNANQLCSEGVCVEEEPGGGESGTEDVQVFLDSTSSSEADAERRERRAISDAGASEPDTAPEPIEDSGSGGPLDTGVEDSASASQEVSGDTAALPDSEEEDPVFGGEFGDPCEDELDCYSGLCVEHMGDEVCSKTCESECPTGWSCEQVILGGSDPIYICVSSFEHLCKPCLEASDCASALSSVACVSYGDEGSFCGAACDESSDCPEGFVCEEGTSTRGGTSNQCVNAEGVCSCSEVAVDMGLATMCEQSNEYGTCSALRMCTDDGLSTCDAAMPEAEFCNGLDDNCDGETDEGELCEDGDQCTIGSCGGEAGCTFEILEGAPCDDGDETSVEDVCQPDGSCLGLTLECPQGPCIQGTTVEAGECVVTYQPEGFACDDEMNHTYEDVCDGAGTCAGTGYTCMPGVCELSSEPNGIGCDIVYAEAGLACDDASSDTTDDQ